MEHILILCDTYNPFGYKHNWIDGIIQHSKWN